MKREDHALLKLPECPIHGEQLLLRASTTAEQGFCGAWYECPQCKFTVLLPSAELKKYQECDAHGTVRHGPQLPGPAG